MALRLVGFILVLLLLWFFATQIVLPLCTSRPLFPTFRREDKDVKRLRDEVNDLQQEVAVLQDVNELSATRNNLVRTKSELEIEQADWAAPVQPVSEPQESNPANPKQ